MDTLPVELFTEILSYLPPASCKSARLTSRQFNAVLARPTFDKLSTFIDPEAAQNTLESTIRDMKGRTRALWSPNCSVPAALPLPKSFLHAMYTALGGQPYRAADEGGEHPAMRRKRFMLVDSSDESSSDESEVDAVMDAAACDEYNDMSAAVMLQRLGRPDVSESMLRQALFRFALYKSYVYDGEGEAPQLWVMSSKKWKYQL